MQNAQSKYIYTKIKFFATTLVEIKPQQWRFLDQI